MGQDNECPKGIELEQRVLAIEVSLREIKEDVSDIRHSLAHRLPLWATALISVLSMVIAGMIGSMI